MATQVIDTLLTWLKFDSDTTGVVKAEKEMHNLEKRTKEVNEVMEAFKRTLEFVGAAFAVDKIVELNNEYDITENKLKSVGLAGKQLHDVTDQILKISNATGTSLEANAELYQQLSVSLGEAANNAEKLKVMDTLTKIFAINGTEVSQSKRAIQDMSKALEGSTVRYQEIKQAMNDVPALQQAISKHFKQMGTTWQEALEGNKFATKDFVKILTDANADVTKQFNLTARTIPQSFTALSNSLALFFGQIGKASGAVGGFTEMLDKFSQKITYVSDWISDNADKVKAIAGAIGTFLSLLAIRFGIMAAAAIAPFLPMIIALTAITLLIQDLYVFLEGGNSAIGDFLHWLGLSSKSIDNVRKTIISFIHGLEYMIKWIFSSKLVLAGLISTLGILATEWAIAKVVGFGKSIGNLIGVISGITKALRELKVVQAAVNAVMAITDVVAAPIEIILLAIAAIIGVLIYVFYKWGDVITSTIEGVAIKGFKKLWGYMKSFWDFLKTMFNDLAELFAHPFKILGSMWKGVESKISGWWGKLKSVLGHKDTKVTSENTDKKQTVNTNINQGKNDSTITHKIKNEQDRKNDGINNPNKINILHTVSNIEKASKPHLVLTPSQSLSTLNQTHNSTFNVTVNAQTSATAAEIAQETAKQTSTMVSQHYRNAALNHDSRIKR